MSHNELVKTFSEDDIKNMQVVLDNTTKNAASSHETNRSRNRKPGKKVCF